MKPILILSAFVLLQSVVSAPGQAAAGAPATGVPAGTPPATPATGNGQPTVRSTTVPAQQSRANGGGVVFVGPSAPARPSAAQPPTAGTSPARVVGSQPSQISPPANSGTVIPPANTVVPSANTVVPPANTVIPPVNNGNTVPSANGTFPNQGAFPNQVAQPGTGTNRFLPSQRGTGTNGFLPSQPGTGTNGFLPSQRGTGTNGFLPSQRGTGNNGFLPTPGISTNGSVPNSGTMNQ